LILSLAIPHAVELSVWTGVAGCGCHISSNVILKMVARFVLSKKAPISASEADDRTAFMIFVVAKIDPLCVSLSLSLFPM
jgi:hypothetical protein